MHPSSLNQKQNQVEIFFYAFITNYLNNLLNARIACFEDCFIKIERLKFTLNFTGKRGLIQTLASTFKQLINRLNSPVFHN
ncbi:hypothetical protein BpHYR1_053099 [Brachionus plicatilis]|uniref:Uncharacterized protein n=1 Tax=Brachionus plicatilis TaxID=10195 RepID=A0A3M7R4W4_BRAPC|nr:hypothetical protein BpHYR1_053099 [Brachionus plicatilis]